MPELPEVQTIIDELKIHIQGRTIVHIEEYRKGTIQDSTDADFLPFRIKEVFRRGKYIVFDSDSEFMMIIHLRMTGKLIFNEGERKLDHVRAEVFFENGNSMLFHDVRTFGKIYLINRRSYDQFFSKLGLEPLCEECNPSYLLKIFKGKTAPVKNILLQQELIAGLGNIYVNEILFRAKVLPTIAGKDITKEQSRRIVESMRVILKSAIENNGTTISDYRRVDNKTGNFQNFLRVYQKKECSCGADIVRIKQAGRSTFYCPECQNDKKK
ncbi:MAG: bifunctional DNA-formamidopyrimidine glycosylase/DNA-(apurinic or apyrimidinic site) lyase [Candidatus Cloacimonetes bacterium]|nr:bifunctional DNA-formamidopyrimidine glycosylase/DNA-(apurinic or apyrimidinic site) lyase [Candidatus Cloacimonadota bacterium]